MYFSPSFPFDFGCCLVGPLICKLAGTSSENDAKAEAKHCSPKLCSARVPRLHYFLSLTAMVSFLKQISQSETQITT
jgi:hypothetical protein